VFSRLCFNIFDKKYSFLKERLYKIDKSKNNKKRNLIVEQKILETQVR
jgi:hypothetical protein